MISGDNEYSHCGVPGSVLAVNVTELPVDRLTIDGAHDDGTGCGVTGIDAPDDDKLGGDWSSPPILRFFSLTVPVLRLRDN